MDLTVITSPVAIDFMQRSQKIALHQNNVGHAAWKSPNKENGIRQWSRFVILSQKRKE